MGRRGRVKINVIHNTFKQMDLYKSTTSGILISAKHASTFVNKTYFLCLYSGICRCMDKRFNV
jgi:hypothetical protein